MQVEVVLDDLGIRLQRRVPGPVLVRENGLLIARPTAAPESLPKVDFEALVAEERDRWP